MKFLLVATSLGAATIAVAAPASQYPYGGIGQNNSGPPTQNTYVPPDPSSSIVPANQVDISRYHPARKQTVPRSSPLATTSPGYDARRSSSLSPTAINVASASSFSAGTAQPGSNTNDFNHGYLFSDGWTSTSQSPPQPPRKLPSQFLIPQPVASPYSSPRVYDGPTVPAVHQYGTPEFLNKPRVRINCTRPGCDREFSTSEEIYRHSNSPHSPAGAGGFINPEDTERY